MLFICPLIIASFPAKEDMTLCLKVPLLSLYGDHNREREDLSVQREEGEGGVDVILMDVQTLT